MENYTLEYLQNYANEILTEIRGLITFQNGIVITIITMFLLCSIIKIFVFIHDKEKLKNNIFDVIKLAFSYYIANSITLIVSLWYNDGPEVSTIISCLLMCYILAISIVYMLFNKFKPYIIPKLIVFKNYTCNIAKNALEELKFEDESKG